MGDVRGDDALRDWAQSSEETAEVLAEADAWRGQIDRHNYGGTGVSEDLASKELPMDEVGLLEGLASTRSIRRYLDEPIPAEVLRAMLFAATRAPSGSNRQPFRFLVLTDGPKAAQAKKLSPEEEAKKKEEAAEKAAKELLQAEEREKDGKKAFKDGSMKKGFLSGKK